MRIDFETSHGTRTAYLLPSGQFGCYASHQQAGTIDELREKVEAEFNIPADVALFNMQSIERGERSVGA